ncbi:aspartate aminotransferase family protein [Leucobacter sp. G161]|uniref:aspartate aminotransferase family protein n=1 Tax=Leucobacter sp. G161 TaxID=663704 RepID=UPI00073BB48E|nr:aminotransferase class III-fold pyridoxal phosphate-dependent enzyme [Leucobacter sp. G161]KUF08606.1 aminotransferase class III [Leucobacter sp. G161]
MAALGRYAKSLEQLERARRVTPLGTQTFSKSTKTLPAGLAPLYSDRAKAGRIWDIDGNEYVDLMSALASVNLGYADSEINAAVAGQLERGTTISLTHPIEAEVAQLVIDLVPCAEKVKFGKNGSDATTAAIRIARAHTGRDHLVTCGYHGWQDWFIGSMDSRSLGVPQAYADLIHPTPYNDLGALEDLLSSQAVAAVVIEPMTFIWPEPGYLAGVKELAHRYGALLIFDEMVTGFRFAPGGAQEYFDVTPDLATFGKGIANGYPLSAVAGRAELIDVLETAFISGTFGGELLSLTAAKVVLERIKGSDVVARVAQTGKELAQRVDSEIEAAGLGDVLSLQGHDAWKFLIWNPEAQEIDALKYLFMQEMSRNGVLMIATHNVTAAHDAADLDHVVAAYRATFAVLNEAIRGNDAAARLDGDIAEIGRSIR